MDKAMLANRIRVPVITGGVALTIGLLTGCAQSTGHDEMNPEESKQQMTSLLDLTVEALGGAGWREEPSPYANGCNLWGEDNGVSFVSGRMAPPSADQASDIALVERLWKEQGFDTRIVGPTDTDSTIQLYGTHGPMKGVSFYADTRGASLYGESLCVIGDLASVIEGDL